MVSLSEERLRNIKNILHYVLIFPKFRSNHAERSMWHNTLGTCTQRHTHNATSFLNPLRFPVAIFQLERKGRRDTA